MRSPVAELIADASAAFSDAGTDWYLFGAQAAILHGVARLTADVDITVRLAAGATGETLAHAVERHGFRRRVSDAAFLQQTSVLPFIHLSTSLPLDLVLAGPGLEDRFFARAETREVDGVSARVASAEDIVVMKVLAGRPKDMDDVVTILASNGERLNVVYLRETLSLLESALGQSDLIPSLEQARDRARRR